MMVPVLLGAVLSLLFFSTVLAAEIRGGDRHRIRELGIILGVLSLVTIYASHALIAGSWAEIASLSALVLPGG
ncbi:MAG TPA: hypothetical protein VF502_11520 [Stellaceae bacterium]